MLSSNLHPAVAVSSCSRLIPQSTINVRSRCPLRLPLEFDADSILAARDAERVEVRLACDAANPGTLQIGSQDDFVPAAPG
jgi:hypothetical protein